MGRVLAETVVSELEIPPFSNSAMDGFAIRSEDTAVPSTRVGLRVVREIAAGALEPGSVGPGEAARIMTGAPMPAGADAVVPFEETSTEDDLVQVPAHRSPGQSVRPAGLDIKRGDVVLEPGARLGAAQIALLASIGTSDLKVHRQPRVAVLTTGDELVEPGRPLRPGQIYNSNAYGLAAAVRELGAEPRVLDAATDDPESLRDVLGAIEDVDLILTSGGVSVGDFDYVKQVIGEAGRVDFWRIRMRPGKPLMLGWLPSDSWPGVQRMILGLPGNPTSTMVTFYVFAQPVILKMMGYSHPVPSPLKATMTEPLDNRGGRETFFRVRLRYQDGRLVASLSGGQDSSMLLPLARADGLARVAAEIDQLDPGDEVDVFLLPGRHDLGFDAS